MSANKEVASHAAAAKDIIRNSIVIDGAAPVLLQDMTEWQRFADHDMTAIFASVSTTDDLPATMSNLSKFHKVIADNPSRLRLVETVEDFDLAHKEGQLGMVLAFQNGMPLARDVGMVELYSRLGVKSINLCYNYRNDLGDGCLEHTNSGLSRFGKRAVTAMNRHGVLVDYAHTGERTTLDAMELSEGPDAFTHANPRAVHDHPRNITDEQIKAVAAKGGIVGLCSFPAHITDKTDTPTVKDLIPHLEHLIEVAGIEHVGLGIDFYHGWGWEVNVELGAWSADEYPKPPWNYPLDGTNTWLFAEELLARGYDEDSIRKVLGGNFMRVLSESWK